MQNRRQKDELLSYMTVVSSPAFDGAGYISTELGMQTSGREMLKFRRHRVRSIRVSVNDTTSCEVDERAVVVDPRPRHAPFASLRLTPSGRTECNVTVVMMNLWRQPG